MGLLTKTQVDLLYDTAMKIRTINRFINSITFKSLIMYKKFFFICYFFITGVILTSKAQNVSYNLNSIPITGSDNVGLGSGVFFAGPTGSQNTAIGNHALYSNTTGNTNTAIGFYSLRANTTGLANTGVGNNSLKANTTGNTNTAIGQGVLASNTTGSNNTGIGQSALVFNTIGSYNTATGAASLFNNTGNYNSAHGYYSLLNNTTGNSGAAFGYLSLYSNTTGSNNTANGNYSLYSNTTGNNNTAIGNYSLYSNTTGTYNTVIGNAADVGSGTLTNATAIGNGAIVTTSNTIQLGNASVTQIFAGTGTTAKFITGGLQVTGGSLVAGKVLTSDATGNATWQPIPGGGGSGWGLAGNAGTVDGTNFIGTTDNVPFNIRVNNLKAGRIDEVLFNAFYGLGRERIIFLDIIMLLWVHMP